MAQPPKGGLVRGYDKQIQGSCAIYSPGGIILRDFSCDSPLFGLVICKDPCVPSLKLTAIFALEN